MSLIGIRKLISNSVSFEIEAREILGIKSKKLKPLEKMSDFKVAIITSSKDEFESISVHLDNLIEITNEDDDSIIYYAGEIVFGTKRINAILPYPISMGIEASVSVTTKILTYYNPTYIFMVGICAGNKNATKIGDIIIAEKSINYNEIVEIEREGKEINKKFMQSAESIKKNFKSRLSLLSTEEVLDAIRKSYTNPEKVNYNLTCHVGLMVTGSSLLRSSEKISDLNKSYHNIKGMDMETHGFYFAANSTFNDKSPYFVSIKSVSDFGDETNHKLSTKERRNLALHSSSSLLFHFLDKLIK